MIALPFCGLHFSIKKQLLVYPIELIALGDHLRASQLDQNLKQDEVAQFIGVDLFTILNWENNKTKPSVKFYPNIMEFLGYCPIHYAQSFGELLMLHRTHRGLTLRKLGRILGFDPASLSRWETSQRKPYRKWRNRLIEFFGISWGLKVNKTQISST